MEKKEIIENLVKNGAVMIKDCEVRNVTVRPQDEYVRLGITLDKPVKGFRQNENEEWEETDVKVIFISAYSVASILKEVPRAAFAANKLLENPESLSVVLSGAKIDVLAEHVASGQEYNNPWSERTDNARVFDHDTIIHHIVKIEISDFGQDMLKQLALNMMGIK